MPRPEVMRHLLAGANLGLLATRQTRDKWDVFVTRAIAGHKSLSAYDITSLFPLYLYPSAQLISSGLYRGDQREPNLARAFIDDLQRRLTLRFTSDGVGDLRDTFGPEDVFHYIYAVLYSPTYRGRYAEFLKIDFPRVPLTSDLDLFRTLSGFGEELVNLHLLQRTIPPITRYPIAGDSTVEAVRYTEPGQGAEQGRVWINKSQYFEGVPPEVWDFYVGGYQVCEKWLKDRKGRQLTYDDLTHYQQIVAALAETMRLTDKIDEVIPGWPLA